MPCLSRGALGLLSEELESLAPLIDSSNSVPESFIEGMRDHGLFSISDVGCLLEAVRTAARRLPAVAHVILVHGVSAYIAGYRGGVYALSITEPGGGTDIRGNLRTTARRQGGGHVVSGEKAFTSNALYADEFLVLAQSPGGPTLFLVPRSAGVEVEPLDLSGFRGSGVGRVRYREAEGLMVGGEGEGLREALRGINLGRLGYASIALGMADRALEILVGEASSREVFGTRLIDYQGIRWMLSSIKAKALALESLVDRAVSGAGASGVDPLLAASAKVLGGELAREASWAALQVRGGRGLSSGSETERMHRDSRVLDIGEGSREVLLDFIAGRTVKELTGHKP